MLHEPQYWALALGFSTVLGVGIATWWPKGRSIGFGLTILGFGGLVWLYFAWPENKAAQGASPSPAYSVEQHSEGPNSPNVSGSGNTVNINPPASAVPNPNQGWLTPGNDPMPPSGCKNIPPNTWRIYYGGSNTAIVPRGGEVRVVQLGELLLWFESAPLGDRIAISAKIYSEDGLAAEINQNAFTKNTNLTFPSDDMGPHRLVVRDKWGDTVLDVTYLNPSAISVKGVFRSRRGAKVVIDDKGLTDGRSTFDGSCALFPFAVYISPLG